MLILHIHLYLDKREHVYCNIRAFLWKIDKKTVHTERAKAGAGPQSEQEPTEREIAKND